MHQPTQTQFANAMRVVVRAAPAGPRRSFIASAAATLLAILRLPGRLLAIRRDMALLAGLDDRELSDIGLCRQDLRDACGLPIGEHPGALFRDRAKSRRRNRAHHRQP